MEISQSIFKIDTINNCQFVERDFIIDGLAYFPAMVLGIWKIIPGKSIFTMRDDTHAWQDFGEFDSADSAIAFAILRAD